MLRSIKLSPPTKWLSMAPKAMKHAKRPSAMKKAHKPAKSKAMQKQRAKAHKVKKKPSQAQASPSQDMDVQGEQEEEQQEEQEAERQEDETTEKGKTKVCAKVYYHFWKSLPEAPRAVQEAVRKVKDKPPRSGKQKQLGDMVRAFAMQKWDHTFFKSLQQERPKARDNAVMPKVIMVAKKAGNRASKQAPCLVNSNVLS